MLLIRLPRSPVFSLSSVTSVFKGNVPAQCWRKIAVFGPAAGVPGASAPCRPETALCTRAQSLIKDRRWDTPEIKGAMVAKRRLPHNNSQGLISLQEEAIMGVCVDSNGDTWEIYPDNRKEWRWRRIARNGRNVGASSEGYRNQQDCIANARRNGMKCTPK